MASIRKTRTMLKILRVVLGLALLVVGVSAGGLGYRAWRLHENAKLRIETQNGIVEAGYVRIGGIEQWIQIRGEDRRNPVILYLHGGPGTSMIPFTYHSERAWERDFTMVHWDQRGAGRTLLRSPAAEDAGIDRFVTDGIEVAEYVRRRLDKKKIIVLGLSWGSVVGTQMAYRRPDLLYAYVGSGQVVDMQANEGAGYRVLMARSRAAGDANAVAELERIGPPPYKDKSDLKAERRVAARRPPALERGMARSMMLNFAFAPGYSIMNIAAIGVGKQSDQLVGDLLKYRAPNGAFAVPMFFFQGAEDITTPTELLESYVQSIAAPQKQLMLVPDAGHAAAIVASEQLLLYLRRQVRPLATQP